jgi:mRNA-degrading endonuclease RelE of RelBE toxin-antitoxin system
MDRISKTILRLSKEDAIKAREIVSRIILNDLQGLNVKKLKGFKNLFRIRFGVVRIVFEDLGEVKKIIFVGKRSDNTYKKLRDLF